MSVKRWISRRTPDESDPTGDHDSKDAHPTTTDASEGHRLRRLRKNVLRGGTFTALVAGLVVLVAAGTGVAIAVLADGGPATNPGTSVTPPTAVTPQSGGSGGSGTPAVPDGPPQGQAPPVGVGGGAAPGHGAFNAVACMSTSTCLAVGADANGDAVIAKTNDAAGHWANKALSQTVGPLNAVSCGNSSHCVAVGQGVIVSSDDAGESWAIHDAPTADTTLLGVSCTTTQLCVSTGLSPDPAGPFRARLIVSTDGGTTWSEASVPDPGAGLQDVTCPTPNDCIAVGATILVSNDGGNSWSPRAVPDGMGVLRSIGCSTPLHCLAVGPNPAGIDDANSPTVAVVTDDGGNTWQPVALPAGSASVNQVTCAGASQCYALGPHPSGLGASNGAATFFATGDGGHTWSAGTPPGQMNDLAAMACSGPTTCVAVGHKGFDAVTASTGDGTNWATTVVPPS